MQIFNKHKFFINFIFFSLIVIITFLYEEITHGFALKFYEFRGDYYNYQLPWFSYLFQTKALYAFTQGFYDISPIIIMLYKLASPLANYMTFERAMLIVQCAIYFVFISSLVNFYCQNSKSFLKPFLFTILALLSPSFIYNNFILGQYDLLYLLAVVMSLIALQQNKIHLAILIVVIGFFCKPQIILLSPIVFYYIFFNNKFLTSALVGVITFFLLLFCCYLLGFNVLWIVENMFNVAQRISGYTKVIIGFSYGIFEIDSLVEITSLIKYKDAIFNKIANSKDIYYIFIKNSANVLFLLQCIFFSYLGIRKVKFSFLNIIKFNFLILFIIAIFSFNFDVRYMSILLVFAFILSYLDIKNIYLLFYIELLSISKYFLQNYDTYKDNFVFIYDNVYIWVLIIRFIFLSIFFICILSELKKFFPLIKKN